MILLDTSIWVEFLRGSPTSATVFVRENVGLDATVTEPVLMELLAGTRPGEHTSRVEQLLLSQRWCHVVSQLDYRGAVDIYQAARARGHQPRSLNDCLIAAVALREGMALAHRDADFAYIAAASGLQTVDLRE